MSHQTSAFQAVLFDLDGTLLDSAPDLALAAQRMRVARSLPELPYEAFRPHASSGARGMLGVAFGVSATDPSYEDLKKEYLDEYGRCLLKHTRFFAGVTDVLRALTQLSMPWGIVTNKAHGLTERVLAGFAELQEAGTLVCGDTLPRAKPHPDPLLEAARRLGVRPSACLYVGDDERDIVAGRAAGMYTVAARYGYLGETGETAHWGADANIDSPSDLLKLLGLP